MGSRRLDPGERAATGLAETVGAGLPLMDDRAGVTAARERGSRVTGTVGVVIEAAAEGLLDPGDAFAALRTTNFRCPEARFAALLAGDRARRSGSG